MNANCFKIYVQEIALAAYSWQPDTTKAVVILLHGMGEHALRYEGVVIPKLLENDYAIVAYDHFGHGRSEGKRGHCPSYDALQNSVEQALTKADSLFPDKPKYLYGHSMGGNLAINYVLRRHPNIRGLIATSPFLRLAFQPPKWKLVLGKLMLHLWPSITLPSELDVKAISRDENEVKRYVEDPLVHDKVSPMFTFPVIEAGEWAIKDADDLKTPALILHGTGDQIIDYKGSVAFAKASDKAELKLFEGGYHELHHDSCREEFMQAILAWLDKV